MRVVLVWLAMVALSLVSGGGGWAQQPGIAFAISGGNSSGTVEGAMVEVVCRVMQDGSLRYEAHSGPLPIDLAFDAEAVTCAVTSQTRVVIEASSAHGNRSRAETSGGQTVVSISD